MKVTMIAGITVIAIFLLYGIIGGGGSLYQFFDMPSILIVLGMLFGGVLISFGIAVPLKAMKNALIGGGVQTIEELRQYVNFFNLASQLSIAGGIIGTLIGLIGMLATMKNPSTIGSSMALVLITVFYGVVLSEFVFQPLKHALINKSADTCENATVTDTGQTKTNRWFVLGLGVFASVFSYFILIISLHTLTP